MRIRSLLAAFAVVMSSVAIAVPPAAAVAPDPPYISGFSYAGSGCPAGSAEVAIATHGRAATIKFDKYLARVGPGEHINSALKTCRLAVKITKAGNCATYARARLVYSGSVAVGNRVTGQRRADYWETGQSAARPERTNFAGLTTKDWAATDSFNLAPAKSPTTVTLNVSTAAEADNSANRRGRGLLGVDEVLVTLTVERTPVVELLLCQMDKDS